jgi:hypothetical protein
MSNPEQQQQQSGTQNVQQGRRTEATGGQNCDRQAELEPDHEQQQYQQQMVRLMENQAHAAAAASSHLFPIMMPFAAPAGSFLQLDYFRTLAGGSPSPFGHHVMMNGALSSIQDNMSAAAAAHTPTPTLHGHERPLDSSTQSHAFLLPYPPPFPSTSSVDGGVLGPSSETNISDSRSRTQQKQELHQQLMALETTRVKRARDRNREHARSTRMLKNDYTQSLVDSVVRLHTERSERARHEREAVVVEVETQRARQAALRAVLQFLTHYESDARAWAAVMDDNFQLQQPLTPFWSFRRAEIENVCRARPFLCYCCCCFCSFDTVRHTHIPSRSFSALLMMINPKEVRVTRGIPAMICEAASIFVMIECIRSRSPQWMKSKRHQFVQLVGSNKTLCSVARQCKKLNNISSSPSVSPKVRPRKPGTVLSVTNSGCLGPDNAVNSAQQQDKDLDSSKAASSLNDQQGNLSADTHTLDSSKAASSLNDQQGNHQTKASSNDDLHEYNAKPLPDPKIEDCMESTETGEKCPISSTLSGAAGKYGGSSAMSSFSPHPVLGARASSLQQTSSSTNGGLCSQSNGEEMGEDCCVELKDSGVSTASDADASSCFSSSSVVGIQGSYHINEDNMTTINNGLMCSFTFRCQDAYQYDAKMDFAIPGMLRTQFSSQNKLLRMELVYWLYPG